MRNFSTMVKPQPLREDKKLSARGVPSWRLPEDPRWRKRSHCSLGAIFRDKILQWFPVKVGVQPALVEGGVFANFHTINGMNLPQRHSLRVRSLVSFARRMTSIKEQLAGKP